MGHGQGVPPALGGRNRQMRERPIATFVALAYMAPFVAWSLLRFIWEGGSPQPADNALWQGIGCRIQAPIAPMAAYSCLLPPMAAYGICDLPMNDYIN
jgi:hypothetical protein